MHDLEKLDAAIQDLETSSFDIKNIRAAYQELVEFGKSLDSMGSKIDVNNRTLSEIAAELRSEQGRISQLSERLAKENLELIEQNNAQMILRLDRYQSEAAEEMHKSFTLIGDKFDTSNATLSNNTEILRTEQERIAQLYKEQAKENLERVAKYDAQMTSRLERFQSDTVVEIRNGSDRTEKLLESALERNIKQIETRFNDGIEQARKRITRWAIASLSLIIVIGSALALLIILSAGSVTN